MASISLPEPLSLSLSRTGTVTAAFHHRPPCLILPRPGPRLPAISVSRRCLQSDCDSRRTRCFAAAAGGTLAANSVPAKNGVYTVGDFMTRKEELHVVKPTTTVDEALEALVENRITGFPVINDDWKLVGLVSDYDLLALDSISGTRQTDSDMFPEVDSTWKTFNEIQKLLGKTNGKMVGDLMTPAPLVVRESSNLEDAARLLLQTKYRRLPVVDADGKLVGIIPEKHLTPRIFLSYTPLSFSHKAPQTQNQFSPLKIYRDHHCIMCDGLKNEYQLCEEIGRGRFGVVYRCFSPVSDQFFACKTIDKRLLLDPTDRECLEKEPKILRFLSGNPHILQIHKLFEDDCYLHIVTDLCDGEDLYNRICRGPFTEPEAASVMSQLMQGIAYCHHMGIAHRDVKPDNILFDSRNRLKLVDFGSAECFDAAEKRTMRGVVGTPYYVAPEILMGREYNEKVDVWSAGVILYIMLAGMPPFYGDTPAETFEAVLRGNLRFPTRIFRSVSPEAKDLLRKMLCKDMSRRLSAHQVLKHPWVINSGQTQPMTDLP